MNTIEEIVTKYLKKNNYDGLCNSGLKCQCVLTELMPCERPLINCKAGYKHLQNDGDWIIKPENQMTESDSHRAEIYKDKRNNCPNKECILNDDGKCLENECIYWPKEEG